MDVQKSLVRVVQMNLNAPRYDGPGKHDRPIPGGTANRDKDSFVGMGYEVTTIPPDRTDGLGGTYSYHKHYDI